MPIKNETSTHFMDEVRIISPVAFCLALLGFLAVMGAVIFAAFTDKSVSPVAMVPFGIFAGTALGCYILLIGYVNRDAGRRGMSRVLWTLIAIFIPNALGIVLYFVLRKPRAANCPQCHAFVEPGFSFCPRCRYSLGAVCQRCQRPVQAGDRFCPYCGVDLVTPANQVVTAGSTSAG